MLLPRSPPSQATRSNHAGNVPPTQARLPVPAPARPPLEVLAGEPDDHSDEHEPAYVASVNLSLRVADKRYLTTTLRDPWAHQKGGGFFHDGGFPTLPSVVD
jgi:hypothetical protein